ncbi:hypothetical protein AB0758_45240 [Tolypothrix bouteillei VB521301_2]|uniref:hypothetical protein n=1 Tax=Tolypothrix bouteillei TaxID=1246981 RepID=UPI000512FD38
MVSQLQVSLEEVREICSLLGLAVEGDKISEFTEQQLLQLKAAATAEGMSLEEAARHLLEMRSRQTSEGGEHRFDKREYIKQRFGVDPEQAAADSFVGMLYRDVDKGIQLGNLRHKVVLESSTLALEELIFHGGSDVDSGSNKEIAGYDQAQERIQTRINNDFFGKINWGEQTHPLLVGTSTPQPKRLKSSQPKTEPSPKK